jgi:hypothetical protein
MAPNIRLHVTVSVLDRVRRLLRFCKDRMHVHYVAVYP